jgi:hypothetical protein
MKNDDLDKIGRTTITFLQQQVQARQLLLSMGIDLAFLAVMSDSEVEKAINEKYVRLYKLDAQDNIYLYPRDLIDTAKIVILRG